MTFKVKNGRPQRNRGTKRELDKSWSVGLDQIGPPNDVMPIPRFERKKGVKYSITTRVQASQVRRKKHPITLPKLKLEE